MTLLGWVLSGLFFPQFDRYAFTLAFIGFYMRYCDGVYRAYIFTCLGESGMRKPDIPSFDLVCAAAVGGLQPMGSTFATTDAVMGARGFNQGPYPCSSFYFDGLFRGGGMALSIRYT